MKILNYIEKVKQENEGPRTMAQEPRIELSGGGAPIDPLDPQFKLADAVKAYQDYYSGPGKKKRKLPFKTFFRIYAKENFADGGSAGQLVTPSVDGSRPGYSGDYTAEERKKQGRTLVLRDGKWMLDMHTPEIKKWYKKNYPDKSWWDQKYKSDILDRYYNELGREKPPKGYITHKEYAKKYGFKIYPATDAKSEGNIIRNLLVRTGDERQLTRDYNEPTKKFFTNELEPKYFKTTYELAPGKKSARPMLYVKDKGKAHANKLLKYWDGTQLRDHTIKNINNILNNEKYKPLRELFEAGNYDGIKQALKKMKGITDAERANVMLRIAQGMSGHGFRDYKPNIELNKVAANKIFKGFEKEPWHTPFSDRYRDIKRNAIMKDIGDGYFTKSYKGFIDDARNSIRKAFPSLDISNMDINELTGLTSGYKNQTFSSTQFVNLMDADFNRKQHASMIKVYGEHEARLQKALSGKRPNYDAAANEVKKWKAWKKNWFDNLDPRYKTEQIKSILPDFKITDKASKVFTKNRLDEFRKINFPIADEIKQKGYAKIAGKTKMARSDIPLLKEVASGDPKAMERIKAQLIDLCPKKASGGRIGYKAAGAVAGTLECGITQFNKNMKTGNANSALMRRILANGGNILKEATKALNPGELLRLRNLVGPQALGFFAGWELGEITTDNLRKGTPWNEAFAKNWLTKSFMPFTQEFARQKNLLKSGLLDTDAQKIYALDMMKAEKLLKEMDRIEGMEANQLVEGTLDDDIIFNSQETIDAAKENVNRILEDLGSRDSFRNTGKQMENIKAMEEKEAIEMAKDDWKPIRHMFSDNFLETWGIGKGFDDPFKPKVTRGERIARTGKGAIVGQEVDYSRPSYIEADTTPLTEEQLQPETELLKKLGYIHPVGGVMPQWLKDNRQIEEKWRQLFEQDSRGLLGTQYNADGGRAGYMGGGITGIRRPHAIPPERGGLRSIMINVNDD